MRVGRAVSITLGIALVGAIIGGAMGAVLFAAWQSVARIMSYDGDGRLMIAPGAAAGALLGAVLAPITSWVFLRRVAIGKARLHTTVGTTAGAAIGLALDAARLSPRTFLPASLVGAIAGFLAAALRLRFARRTPARQAGTESSRAGSEP